MVMTFRMPERMGTSTLVVDVDIVQRNVNRFAEMSRTRGIRLHHFKTHETLELARHQLQEGECGLSVASIGEAEFFSQSGRTEIFVTHPFLAHDDGENPSASPGRQHSTGCRN